MLELLISKGADINAKDEYYCKMQILLLVIWLLNNIRKFKKFQKTPLHIAVKFNFKEILIILISKGADINAKDFNEQQLICIFKLI